MRPALLRALSPLHPYSCLPGEDEGRHFPQEVCLLASVGAVMEGVRGMGIDLSEDGYGFGWMVRRGEMRHSDGQGRMGGLRNMNISLSVMMMGLGCRGLMGGGLRIWYWRIGVRGQRKVRGVMDWSLVEAEESDADLGEKKKGRAGTFMRKLVGCFFLARSF